MRRFIWHAELRGNRSFGARPVLGILHQLPDQRLPVLPHALDQGMRKEARRLAKREWNFHPASRSHLAPQPLVFVGSEVRIECVPIRGDHRSSWSDGRPRPSTLTIAGKGAVITESPRHRSSDALTQNEGLSAIAGC